MACTKCFGLMIPDKVYTEGGESHNILRCMNCGKCEYAPIELRIIPIEDLMDEGRDKHIRKSTCKHCKKEYTGLGSKYCKNCRIVVATEQQKLRREKLKQGTVENDNISQPNTM